MEGLSYFWAWNTHLASHQQICTQITSASCCTKHVNYTDTLLFLTYGVPHKPISEKTPAWRLQSASTPWSLCVCGGYQPETPQVCILHVARQLTSGNNAHTDHNPLNRSTQLRRLSLLYAPWDPVGWRDRAPLGSWQHRNKPTFISFPLDENLIIVKWSSVGESLTI